MADSADRPVPRAGRINAGEREDILRELLAVERARLAQAVEMERARSIVFPETTVIIKDIERLMALLAPPPVQGGPADDGLDRLMRSLRDGADGSE